MQIDAAKEKLRGSSRWKSSMLMTHYWKLATVSAITGLSRTTIHT